MDKIKAFFLNFWTALASWLALAAVAAITFISGVVSGNWGLIILAVVDILAALCLFIGKLLSGEK